MSFSDMEDQMPDTNGKPWALVAETRKGSVIRPDADFDCLSTAAALTVEEDEDGLYVPCTQGRHGLDGQISDDGTEYVGFYPVVDGAK